MRASAAMERSRGCWGLVISTVHTPDSPYPLHGWHEWHVHVTNRGPRSARDREAQGERAPLPFRARGDEIAAHPARELAADREAETHALVGARVVAIHLHERLEDPLQLVAR